MQFVDPGSQSAVVSVAVDLTSMRPGGENGGVKFAILELLRGLKRQAGDRLTFLFLTASDSHEEVNSLLGEDDTAVCVLQRREKGFQRVIQALELLTRARLQVVRLLEKHRVDVVYWPFGWVPFGRPQLPTVVLVTDLLHKDFPFSLSIQDKEWRELHFKKVTSSVDFYQVISDFTAQRLQRIYGVSPDRIFRTYLPIYNRLLHENERERAGTSGNERPPATLRVAMRVGEQGGTNADTPTRPHAHTPFFFYPANFWLHKNHEILLIAYQHYVSQMENRAWDLVLTGHLDERGKYLQRVAGDLGVAARVKFLGHVPEKTLEDLYSSASCLVFPSLYEGFGIPLVEAMSFGLPILAGREASIPEIAGETAFYTNTRNPLELASALRRITEDDVLRTKLIELGKTRLDQFDLSTEVKHLADALAAAAKSGQRLRRKGSWFSPGMLREEGIYYVRSIARLALQGLLSSDPERG